MQRSLRGLVQPLLAVVVLAWLCSTSQQQEQQQASGSPDANAVYLERMEVLPPPASRPWHFSLQQVMLNSHPVTAPSAPAAAAPAMAQHPNAGSTAEPSLQGQGPHATLSAGPSAHPAASSNNSRSHASTSTTPSPSGSIDPGTPFPLAPLLASWEFTLPENALRKGTGYVGSNHRLRRAVRDALNGRPLKIGAVGGSITYGDKSSHKGRTDWVALLAGWAARAFRNASTLNGAMPGTPSSYMVMCLDHSVEPDTDIVFVEYLLNDGFEDQIKRNEKLMAYEKLVRRIMALPHRPAVVLMQVLRHGMAQDRHDIDWQPFHATPEEVYGSLAQYYDAQYLSLRSATYRLARMKQAKGFLYSDLMEPYEPHTHPMDAGHKVMADLAVWLLQQTALDLLLRPWGHADAEQLREGLPPPMMPGNHAPTAIMCVQGFNFPQVITSAEGWEFTNEGTDKKPKTGYVTRTPGSVLSLMLDTMRPGSAGDVVVSVGHLKSYEHMGKARLSCVSGCKCKAREVDAHHDLKASQTYLSVIDVSQHANCSISIEVLQETSSGEHKFKVSGITVSDTADPPRLSHLRDGTFLDAAIFMARNKDPEGFGKWLRQRGMPPSERTL